MLKSSICVLKVNYAFGIFQLRDIELLKIGESHDMIANFRYYIMMNNKRIIINAKFKLVSTKESITNHGKHT